MRCDEVARRLAAAGDRDAPAAPGDEVRAHLESCPGCRADQAAAERLQAAVAALPREVAPGRDLWPGIAARLAAAQVVPIDRAPRTPSRRTWVALAMAATLALAAGLALVASRSGSPAREAALPTAVPGALPVRLEAGADSFRQARAALRAALAARRGSLAPETRRVVDDNLEIIDRAVASIEAALARDPGNVSLEQLLVAARSQEIELLQCAAELAASGGKRGRA